MKNRIAKKISFWVFFGCFIGILQAAKINEKAPPFSLRSSRHNLRSLNDYNGKILFINFWASWCAPCQKELPQLDQLMSEYKGKEVSLVAINIDTDRSQAEATLEKLRIGISKMEILLDPESKVVSAYNVDSMPSSFILDQNGIIRFVHMGFHKTDPEKWRIEINELLKNLGKN